MTFDTGKSFGNKKDIPLPLALMALGVVTVAIFGSMLPSPETMDAILGVMVEKNRVLFTVFGFSFVINSLWMISAAFKYADDKRQGVRLKMMRKKQALLLPEIVTEFILPLGISCMTYAGLSFFSPIFIAAPELARFKDFINSLFNLSCCTAIFVVLRFVSKRISLKYFIWRRDDSLSPYPKNGNEIVLGSVNEGVIENKKSRWASINGKALCSNILITGSIGSGKTQGAILPYFEQILKNFRPRPAVLAIDPKGSFIREALNIAEKEGLSNEVLHLKLGGSVTFNPIYAENPLRSARYLDIAQMIRAASINFSGSSFDAPFWEISAFNLTKNALCYVAAKFGYYTLNDLYEAIVRSAKEKLGDELREVLREKEFNEEERANITHAIKYFDHEFGSLDVKVKTGILATSTSFLGQFQEYQASQIFCPKEDRLTLRSINDVIENGKILLFDVVNPGLARSMGTFAKLRFEDALLSRIGKEKADASENPIRHSFMIIDEYQDVVSVGGGKCLGDDTFLAKAREARASTIAATQSLTSLDKSLPSRSAARELFQNFRTRIALHSSDSLTIQSFQELSGDVERERMSHSISEQSQNVARDFLGGGFRGDTANIGESITLATRKEPLLTGKDFSGLKSFEAFSLIYDGIETSFTKLFLKPYHLENRATSHERVISSLGVRVMLLGMLLFGSVFSEKSADAMGLPTVCDIVKTTTFSSCLQFSTSSCTCSGFPPRPCVRFSYYVPDHFIEVHPHPGESFFRDLPAAALQLSRIKERALPYGALDDEGTYSFHSHVIKVPFSTPVFNALPCRQISAEAGCFTGMSEHFGTNWKTGAGDLMQPLFLAWMASPKACLLKGAATSFSGDFGNAPIEMEGTGGCSVEIPAIKKFPPSPHSACNGWGTFYPRSGGYEGASETVGALMIASRIKSLSSEVLRSTSTSRDEKWQMILPNETSCFREGENIGFLEGAKNLRELGRLTGKGGLRGYLFTVYRKMSCCLDVPEMVTSQAVLGALKASCH